MTKRIKITYDGIPNPKLDQKLSELCASMGYIEVGTSYGLKTGKRELTFEQPEEPKKEPEQPKP